MFKFKIKEDTITDYLKQLDELAHNTTNQKRFLKTAASEMHFDYIEPLIPKWNPNLMYSPLEEDNQIYKISNNFSSIELIYTGFTDREFEREGNGLFKVYSEFGDKYTGELYRDYAFYQETGFDWDAPHFEGHHYALLGTQTYQAQYYMTVLYYLDDVMNLKPHKNRKFVDLYDYEELFSE